VNVRELKAFNGTLVCDWVRLKISEFWGHTKSKSNSEAESPEACSLTPFMRSSFGFHGMNGVKQDHSDTALFKWKKG
jgi:hypothetical protein